MKKTTPTFVCTSCGSVYSKWAGKCDACGEWNTILEETAPASAALASPKSTGGKGGKALQFKDLSGSPDILFRLKTGIGELDRVTGGGLVAGSVLLIGGDPGIGKSTLMLEVVSRLSRIVNLQGNPVSCAYISGEESEGQIQLRAKRLGYDGENVALASATSVRDIVASLKALSPDVVVIDSIQTMFVDTLDSAPGSVGQVRASAHELISLAKEEGFVLFIIGHMTKDGQIAGPKVLEHMVDTVLYFEGDRGHYFRILRAIKNRFGATDEIGVFEMTDKGLEEVPNPSSLFLAERRGNISGACVYAGIEGSRPILVEVQALISPASGVGMPRRAVVGWDFSRLAMILAVLEARCGVRLADKDVYLNIAGGLKVTEPAADLAVATALLSALSGIPTPADMAVFGEIGLSGEVRAVSLPSQRLKEAGKMGFKRALIPPPHRREGKGKDDSDSKPTENKKDKIADFPLLKATEIGNIQSIVKMFGLIA